MINNYLLEPFARSYHRPESSEHRTIDEIVRRPLRTRLGLRLVEFGTSLIGDETPDVRAA